MTKRSKKKTMSLLQTQMKERLAMSTVDKVDEANVMIDLETHGVNPGCVILSIGATTFAGGVPRVEFYEKISPVSSRALGFFEDIDTLRWWARQPEQVYEEALSGTEDAELVLVKFADYLRQVSDQGSKELRVWGNGADFDLPILAAYYLQIGRPIPWKPYSGRCFRTLKSIMPHVILDKRDRTGHHNALGDAKWQAEHAELLLNVL